MRISVLGGGPAGLYVSLLAKKADPAHRITLVERNAPDATYGWGVVFSEETLGALRDADRATFDEIVESFATWTAIDVKYRGRTIRSRGHAFSAIARVRLLRILQDRCRALGVELRFGQEVSDASELPDADLIVAADGLNSRLRQAHAEALRPTRHVHATRYAWFGTDLVFPAFTFIFRESEHGLFQVHGYPFDERTSTFIVECSEPVWRRAGLDRATEDESIAFCERLFAEDLAGHRLLSNRSLWMSFVTLRNEAWHDGNVVFMGDAVHTAHFTIGSGTKLAMEDAISLVDALERHPGDLPRALTDYELERQPTVERLQQAAMESAAYFENVRRYAGFEPIQFAFNLLTRSGRITHRNLEMRDPAFVASVDGWFARRDEDPEGGSELLVAPPPRLATLRLSGLEARNRVVLAPRCADDAIDGTPGADQRTRLAEAALAGPGVVLTGPVAVAPAGRITSGSPGMYGDGHAEAWREIADAVHDAGATLVVRLSHAGSRGATRPRAEGVSRPLRSGGWELIAASALRYAPGGSPAREATEADLAGVREAFLLAAGIAASAGVDGLLIDLAHGHLLAGFLSPLTNRRADRYGGGLEERLRFPLEVFEAARDAWGASGPIGVSLTATDWAPGGLDVEDAVEIARALLERGCRIVDVRAGQTTVRARPVYGRMYLVGASDRIRNEAGVATLVSGAITTFDEVDTVIAAGRADLCVLDPGVSPIR